MRYSEQFMEHIEYTFNAFCRIVLHYEAINAWRDLKRKEAREISLDYLMSEGFFEPSVMDRYFGKQDKPTAFLVLRKGVIVDNEQLATALSRSPRSRRKILLLYYFVGYRDETIDRLYGRCRGTINSGRNVALKQLRKGWERLEHEKQEVDTFRSNQKSGCRRAGSDRRSIATLCRIYQVSV